MSATHPGAYDGPPESLRALQASRAALDAQKAKWGEVLRVAARCVTDVEDDVVSGVMFGDDDR